MREIIMGTVAGVMLSMLGVVLFYLYVSDDSYRFDTPQSIPCTEEVMLCADGSSVSRTGLQCEFAPCPTSVLPDIRKEVFGAPLDQASERIMKKPFGILIDSKTSPVQPERFGGYHTGTDFETFPNEKSVDVSVRAICTGEINMKRQASGYGGLVVQQCTLDGEAISIVYGHLALRSVTAEKGDILIQGDVIGILEMAESIDTDGERKHLHLGIFRGDAINILGYVPSQKELDQWIDPCILVCK
ncbi:MAG: M23 family metallopeptidase [Candidatus Moranbacteria bacterium]|nr:M23 family metallopeptidase [Candidatus Moranbacteria bacterium]MDD3965304.1 M23 family metallopeptidase [Candidatus Moranbacteria bacterium]